MTDAELSRRCRQQDNGAWRALVAQFTPQVYRLALRMLRSDAESQDACQEAFMRIYKSFDSYDPTRPLSPWISRITYHVCLRRLQSSAALASRNSSEDELSGLPDPGSPNPERMAQHSEASEILELALSELSAQDQALIAMRYHQGLSDSEVAEATDMPVNTVKTRLFRARNKLKKRLSPLFGKNGES